MVQDGLHEIKDVIQNIRESIKYLKMSSSILHNFAEIAKQVNIPVARRLGLDVPTRWNSTYAMLESVLIFRDVIPRYGDRDNNYVWLPSDLDWEKAENVCKILEVFHDASNVFSGVSYPTSNLFLPEIWKVKQILNEKSVEFDETHYLKSMVDRMKSKFEKYWGQCNLLMSIAAILDPRFKMKLIEFLFPKIYPAQEADKNIRYVIDSLYELYAEYVASNAVSNDKDEDKAKGEASNSVSTHIKGKTKGRSKFDIWAKQMDKVEPSKSDLDVYLEEGIYLCENDEDFSPLNWWKNKTLQFKLLSKMARDILSIPVSTVASESAFSAGGRVLDQYRSSMKPETVEALICTGDWLRSEYGLANSEVGLQRDEESMQEVHLE
ncbi:zinc finger BED domain-containing protein RICESLEEPER 2-like [Iris pallida]|uniref:Zinc finger BED domain-containing protein RICESLEEPER 2-like n=1 Tax=Iris pallida TaxID=29817 RepID=A0AAX6FFC1_IRIPA|nr:zinc finger BED domain-containing protein RICESLEEPER 2-like [Iris pallida]